jgi:murein L,D-transpeptidase YafK
MLLSLLGSAALAAASFTANASNAAHADTTKIRTIIASPTISRSPAVNISSAITADSIVVEKGKRTLTLYQLGVPVRTYKVALGKQPVGDKIKIGDNRTPEGVFFIDFKKPESKYYKSLHISYPDAAHAERASKLGVAPGGDIMIHGLPAEFAKLGQEHRTYDWTEGCIALTNAEIDEIWRAIPMGAAIQIKP